jgi:hypothetical protein
VNIPIIVPDAPKISLTFYHRHRKKECGNSVRLWRDECPPAGAYVQASAL